MEGDTAESYYVDPVHASFTFASMPLPGLSLSHQTMVKTSKIIDGVVFAADTLEFFTLPPPLSMDKIWVNIHRVQERFKGLERWWKELPHVLEIKLFQVRGYPVSILFAYNGTKGINFQKVIEKVNAAKVDAMNSLPDSSTSKSEFKNSCQQVARFVDENDFQQFQNKFKTYLDIHLVPVRPCAKTCFILYKFGQCTEWEGFHQEFTWILQNNLSHLVIHYARDFKMENHILWYIPAAIKKELGTSPASIYYVGLQPGLGNVRHNFKQNLTAGADITHVTWYTRIWNEIHRDGYKFFTPERRLCPELQKIVEECFLSKRVKTMIPNQIREQIPRVVRNTANLLDTYPARCEAVIIFERTNLVSASLQNLIEQCVELADSLMTEKKYYSPAFLFPQLTKTFKDKIGYWFLKFAGTIERTVSTVSRVKVARDKLEDGGFTPWKLDCFQQLMDLFTIDVILTLCYTGTFVVKRNFYTKLRLDNNYFISGLQPDFKTFFSLKTRFIDGKDCAEVCLSKQVFFEYFHRIFRAEIPQFYDSLLENINKLKNYEKRDDVPIRDKLNEKKKMQQNICSAIVDVLQAMSFQFSEAEGLEMKTLRIVATSIKLGSFKGANVFTSTELVSLLEGNAVGKSGLDDRFYIIRRILIKMFVHSLPEQMLQFLDDRIVNRIIEEKTPLVFHKSSQPDDSQNIIITPGFREQYLTSFKLAYNKSWTYAAHLYRGDTVPTLTRPIRAYEFFETLTQKTARTLNKGTFVDMLAYAINLQSGETGEPPAGFNMFPEEAKKCLLNRSTPIKKRPLTKSAENKAQVSRTKKGKYIKKRVSKEEFENENDEFLAAVAFMERSQNLEMGPATDIFEMQSGIPVVLSELACSFSGNRWMSNLAVNAFMEMLAKQIDSNFFETNVVLAYDTLICITEGSWSTREERLFNVTPSTKKIYHIVTLVNHFVLIICQLESVGNFTAMEMFTYNPKENEEFYQEQARIAVTKFRDMIKNHLTKYNPDIHLRHGVSKSCSNMQQEDEQNCGPACLKFFECTLKADTTDTEKFDEAIKLMPFEDYKWKLTLDLLNQSVNGTAVCRHFNGSKRDIVDFLVSNFVP